MEYESGLMVQGGTIRSGHSRDFENPELSDPISYIHRFLRELIYLLTFTMDLGGKREHLKNHM